MANKSLDDAIGSFVTKKQQDKEAEEAANVAYDEGAWDTSMVFSGVSGKKKKSVGSKPVQQPQTQQIPKEVLEEPRITSESMSEPSVKMEEKQVESQQPVYKDSTGKRTYVPKQSVQEPSDTDAEMDIDMSFGESESEKPKKSSVPYAQSVSSSDRARVFSQKHEENVKSGIMSQRQKPVFTAAEMQRVMEEQRNGAYPSMYENTSLGAFEEALFQPEDFVTPYDTVKAARKAYEKSRKPLKSKGGQSSNGSKKNGSEGNLEASDEVSYSHVRHVPKPLIDYIVSEFKGRAKNNTDALVAWIICHADNQMITQLARYVTESQMELIEQWNKTPDVQMQIKLDRILKNQQQLNYAIDTVRLQASYLTFDRLGYRKENQPPNPRYINFMESGVLDVEIRAEEQTAQMRNERGIRKGRPIK